MQITRLKIDNYKCLNEFDVTFDIDDGGCSTILIGPNGSGKSTCIEALLLIVMSFDSHKIARNLLFSYELHYLYAGQAIKLVGNQNAVDVTIDGSPQYHGSSWQAPKRLRKKGFSIMPERVQIFYSGNSFKLTESLQLISRKYKSVCTRTLRKYLSYIENPTDSLPELIFPANKYIYSHSSQNIMFLCAMLCGNDSYEKTYLNEVCNFSTFGDLQVELDLSFFRRGNMPITNDNNQAPTVQEVESYYLDCLTMSLDFIESPLKQVFLDGLIYGDGNKYYFQVRGLSDLGLDSIAIYNALEKLQLLFRAKYHGQVMLGTSEISTSELSEGQYQIIRILGATGLCKNEDTLVLMDEPDAHMNPRWKYDLKNTIDKSLEVATNTQAIIATHEPLVISGVDSKFIRIFEGQLVEDAPRSFVRIPDETTKGMGIDGLLQSQYYGLKTSYDRETSEKYERRRLLYIKLINRDIDEFEKVELRQLTRETGRMTVANTTIDFLYDDFMNVFRQSECYTKEYLEYDQIVARRQKIKEIIETLYEGQV